MEIIIVEKNKESAIIEHVMPNVLEVDFDFTTNTWVFVRMEQKEEKIRECINFNEILSIKCIEEK